MKEMKIEENKMVHSLIFFYEEAATSGVQKKGVLKNSQENTYVGMFYFY